MLKVVLLILGCLSFVLVHGQSHEKKGDTAWEEGRYKTAVNNYNMVEGISNNKKLLAKRGLGYYKLNKLKKAMSDFTLSKKLGNDDPNLYFLMGSAKQHLGQYEEAAYFYKQYVKEEGDKSKEAKIALREIKNSAYAAFHSKDKNTAYVENFGEELNSYYDELYVLQSPQQGNAFYFTSNSNLESNEVYLRVLDEKGNWLPDSTRLGGINSAYNDYAMDISPSGRSMIFSRYMQGSETSKIYVSAYDIEEKQHIIELPDYMLTGAVDLQIVDRNTIAFASKELGGEGGYDIFTINYKNGVWSDPINQGSIINSEHDERSPYFASNENYLYFSSNRPYCFGGFDVYYYNKLGIEDEPTNMGAPLNSAGDDLQFRLHQDGQFAVLSSNRKTGYGAFDIYQAYLSDFKPMPIKDTVQLEYVRDYLTKFQPVHQPEFEDRKLDMASNEPKEEEKPVEPMVEKEAVMEESEEMVLSEDDKLTNEAAPVVDLPENNHTNEEANDPMKEDEVINNEEVVEQVDTDVVEIETNTSDTEKVEAHSEMTPKEELNELPPNNHETEMVKGEAYEEGAEVKQIVTDSEVNDVGVKQMEKRVLEDVKPKSTDRYTSSSGTSSAIQNSFLYQDRHDLKNEENLGKLDYLIDYLKSNKEHTIHLIAHTDHLEPGLDEYMQYNTLKRATLIGRHLMENGINRQRVSIESVSDNFPVAKEELAGETNVKYLYYNKRIDWEIRDRDGIVLTDLSVNTTSLPGFALDRRYELFHQIREDVYYSVEIASSGTIFKNAVLRLYDDIYIRKRTPIADNKYYIGILKTYEDAVLLAEELQASSAPYAKVVAFHHGMPISNAKLNEYIKEFPELQAYKDNK